MGVSIKYHGRFGNHLFQYICARLFSEKYNIKLITQFTSDIVHILPNPDGIVVDGDAKVIRDNDNVLDKDWPIGRYVFDGYFQNSNWYYDAKDKIYNFVEAKEVQQINKDDVVMHIRTGDYSKLGWVIHPSWYTRIIESLKYNKLYLVTDSVKDDYLMHFRKYKPIIISKNANDDFNFIRSFDRIICSNSSFCWWAVFFSKATKVYTFKRWVPYRVNKHINLPNIPNAQVLDGSFYHEIPPKTCTPPIQLICATPPIQLISRPASTVMRGPNARSGMVCQSTRFKKNSMPPGFYINLENRKGRRDSIEHELNNIGIVAERVKAEQDNKESHIKALTLAEKRGFKKVFVFEDDAYFLDDVKPALLQSITDVEKLDWHLLFLYYSSWGNLLKKWQVKPHTQDITEYISRISGTKMSHAYIANLNKITDIVRALREWRGRHGVDAAYSIAPWLFKYCTTKNLVLQFSCYSDISHFFKKRPAH